MVKLSSWPTLTAAGVDVDLPASSHRRLACRLRQQLPALVAHAQRPARPRPACFQLSAVGLRPCVRRCIVGSPAQCSFQEFKCKVGSDRTRLERAADDSTQPNRGSFGRL